MRTRAVALALASAFSLGSSPAAFGELLLASANGQAGNLFSAGATGGYRFTLTQSAQTTALGIYDHNADGLQTAHAVGLWTGTGLLLAQVTVPQGSAAGLEASFRLVDLPAPIDLAPGDYVLGAHYPTLVDLLRVPNSPALFPATPPFVQLHEARIKFGTGLVFPGGGGFTTIPGALAIGPNLRFAAAEVPEPGSLAVLVACGMAAAITWRRVTPKRGRVSPGRCPFP